jgi:hypothetical protein
MSQKNIYTSDIHVVKEKVMNGCCYKIYKMKVHDMWNYWDKIDVHNYMLRD